MYRHDLVGTRITGALSGEEIHEMGTPSVVVHRAFSAGRINDHLAADSAGAKHLRGHEIDAFSRIVLGLQEGAPLPYGSTLPWKADVCGGTSDVRLGHQQTCAVQKSRPVHRYSFSR